MSGSNGVIRIGRKGLKKFAFGDDGAPFEIDVVATFQRWIEIDEQFRPEESNEEGSRSIPTTRMPEYHQTAVLFIKELGGGKVTIAEALDFLARLRECYDELVVFFRPKSREERDSPDTSEVELRFSAEAP